MGLFNWVRNALGIKREKPQPSVLNVIDCRLCMAT
jgi:hypothetical protein